MASPFAQVFGVPLWEACDVHDVRVAADGVELAWTSSPAEADGADAVPAKGLAFDRGCRLFRQRPGSEELERVLWERRRTPDPAVFPLHVRPGDAGDGDFEVEAEAVAFTDVTALAVDGGDRLFVAEFDSSDVRVFDLWNRTRVATLAPAGSPVTDLAPAGCEVLAAIPAESTLARMAARGSVVRLDLPEGVEAIDRLDIAPDGWIAALAGAGTSSAKLVILKYGRDALGRREDRLEAGPEVPVPWGGDVAVQADGRVVVARTPGVEFLRFRVGDALSTERPLRAPGYAGDGIARDPDGGIAFWSDLGPRAAVDAAVRHAPRGTVRTVVLDAGRYRARWGRMFVDAALPRETSVRARFVASDSEEELVFEPTQPFRPLHPRHDGRELPFVPPPGKAGSCTLEGPVMAEAGRYLRLELLLTGNTRVSPHVRAIRVETRGHDALERLPRVFSRDEEAASFLRRFLAPLAGQIRDLDGAGQARHRLLVPETAPADVLPWLAGFLGLVLDARWPDRTRRALIDEANELFRRRGTPGGLRRFLELFVEAPVRIVEHFRLRGLGGGFLRREGEASSTAVLGGGFRVGGSIGTPGRTDTEPLGAELGDTDEDAWAHRFTVLVGRTLDEEQLRAVHRILEVHRPAHTVVDEVCAPGSGSRVGRGLHLGLSTFVGPTGGFTTAQVGNIALGRDGLVGRPQAAPHAGPSDDAPPAREARPC